MRLEGEYEASGLRPAEFCRNYRLALSILRRQLKRWHVKNDQAKAWSGHSRVANHRLAAVEMAGRGMDRYTRKRPSRTPDKYGAASG
jgi:hypothetical protein